MMQNGIEYLDPYEAEAFEANESRLHGDSLRRRMYNGTVSQKKINGKLHITELDKKVETEVKPEVPLFVSSRNFKYQPKDYPNCNESWQKSQAASVENQIRSNQEYINSLNLTRSGDGVHLPSWKPRASSPILFDAEDSARWLSQGWFYRPKVKQSLPQRKKQFYKEIAHLKAPRTAKFPKGTNFSIGFLTVADEEDLTTWLKVDDDLYVKQFEVPVRGVVPQHKRRRYLHENPGNYKLSVMVYTTSAIPDLDKIYKRLELHFRPKVVKRTTMPLEGAEQQQFEDNEPESAYEHQTEYVPNDGMIFDEGDNKHETGDEPVSAKSSLHMYRDIHGYLRMKPESEQWTQKVYKNGRIAVTVTKRYPYQEEQGILIPEYANPEAEAKQYKLASTPYLPMCKSNAPEGRHLRPGDLKLMVYARPEDYKRYVARFGPKRVILSSVRKTGDTISQVVPDDKQLRFEAFKAEITDTWKRTGAIADKVGIKDRHETMEIIQALRKFKLVQVRYPGQSNQQIKRKKVSSRR